MPRDHSDALVGQACIEAARCMARAVIVAIDDCQGNERGLTQLQQIDLLQAALIVFDGFQAELTATYETIAKLSDIGGQS